MADLGAHWTRYSLLAARAFIEPVFLGGYDWTTTGGRAERYDGDGYQDVAPASTVKVNYFQFANEMQDWFDRGLNETQYVAAAEMTLNSLRAANPQAQLVLVTGFSNPNGPANPFLDFKKVIDASKARGVPFAAVDAHWWWWTDSATEAYASTASWVGSPNNMPAQTEALPADILVRRYV